MASSKEYLSFILEQLSGLEEITYRSMMGEYIIYYRGKIAACICDDRFLAKPVKAAAELMPYAQRELPYEGAKEMLLVENVDDREFLERLFKAIYTVEHNSRLRKYYSITDDGTKRIEDFLEEWKDVMKAYEFIR